MERTLAIIKPDAVSANNVGAIIDRLEEEGFRILGMRVVHLTKTQAAAFYAVHRERPFFDSLVRFMTGGPCIPMALERDDAVVHLREVMGATDPEEASAGTIRAELAASIERNAIHGSDSAENAAEELSFFFSRADLIAAR